MNYIARTITSDRGHIKSVNNVPYKNIDKAKMVLCMVADYFGISSDVIRTKTRKREICYPRQIVTYLLHVTTTMTLQEIAVFLAQRDHTTALYSHNTIKDLMDSDEKIREEVQHLRDKI